MTPERWNRDTELAVRGCLSAAASADLSIDFMYEFDDDQLVREIQDPCDEADLQLSAEDGRLASEVALTISRINLDLAVEIANWLSGEPARTDRFDYFFESFKAEGKIP